MSEQTPAEQRLAENFALAMLEASTDHVRATGDPGISYNHARAMADKIVRVLRDAYQHAPPPPMAVDAINRGPRCANCGHVESAHREPLGAGEACTYKDGCEQYVRPVPDEARRRPEPHRWY